MRLPVDIRNTSLLTANMLISAWLHHPGMLTGGTRVFFWFSTSSHRLEQKDLRVSGHLCKSTQSLAKSRFGRRLSPVMPVFLYFGDCVCKDFKSLLSPLIYKKEIWSKSTVTVKPNLSSKSSWSFKMTVHPSDELSKMNCGVLGLGGAELWLVGNNNHSVLIFPGCKTIQATERTTDPCAGVPSSFVNYSMH